MNGSDRPRMLVRCAHLVAAGLLAVVVLWMPLPKVAHAGTPTPITQVGEVPTSTPIATSAATQPPTSSPAPTQLPPTATSPAVEPTLPATDTPVATNTPVVTPSPTPTSTLPTISLPPRVVQSPMVPTHGSTAVPHRQRQRHRHHRRHHPKLHQQATPGPRPTIAKVSQPIVTAPSVAFPTVEQLRLAGKLPGGRNVPWSVKRWAYLILPAAHAAGIPPALIAAVMTVESRGDPLAWNAGSDARGLMQILHGPWDPRQNVDIGAEMLASAYREFGNWRLALAAYNAGPQSVINAGGVPPITETRDYVVIVTYLYDLYSHHPLTVHRRRQFRATLHQYRRIAPHLRRARLVWSHASRVKARRLGTSAFRGLRTLLRDSRCGVFRPCAVKKQVRQAAVDDPFWPLGGTPDPLPLVAPRA